MLCFHNFAMIETCIPANRKKKCFLCVAWPAVVDSAPRCLKLNVWQLASVLLSSFREASYLVTACVWDYNLRVFYKSCFSVFITSLVSLCLQFAGVAGLKIRKLYDIGFLFLVQWFDDWFNCITFAALQGIWRRKCLHLNILFSSFYLSKNQ